MRKHVRFPVEGMTCTSCVARITRAVRHVDGVSAVKVDLRSETIRVGFEADRTSLAAIGSAIERAGYAVRLADAEPWILPERQGLRGRLGW